MRIVGLLMACVAVSHFNRISITVAGTEQIIPSEGVDKTAMGAVYSAYLLIYTLCMIPGGWLIDRVGPWKALLLVCFGSVLFVALTGTVGWLALGPTWLVITLALTRGALGSVNAPIHPGSAHMVALCVPPSARNICNGLAVGAACVGIAAAPVGFGMLIDAFGWRGAFVVAAGVPAVLGVLWLTLAGDAPERVSHNAQISEDAPHAAPAAPGTAWNEFSALLQNRNLIVLTISYGLLSYFQYLFFYWMQDYFMDVLDVDKQTSRLYTTIPILAMGAGMIAGGQFADLLIPNLGGRAGARSVPIFGLSAAAACVVLGLREKDPLIVEIYFALSMFGAGIAEGPYWTGATTLGRHRGGTAAAILNTGGNGIGLLAPVVTPLFGRFLGFKAGFALAAITCAAAAVLWLWVPPSREVGHAAGKEMESSEED